MHDPLVAALERLASRAPQAPLLVSRKRPAFTVAAVARLSRATADILPAGLAPGALVGLAASNGPAFIAGLIALRRRELVALLLDPQAPQSDSQRAASALGASALLSCREAWPEDAGCWSVEPIHPSEVPSLPASIAAVKLTSGSTGGPRGVAVTGDALLADDAALASSMGLRESDRILAAIPMSHSYGFASIVLPALVRGSAIVVPEAEGPLSALQAAAALEATVFPTVPAYLQALLKMSQPPPWPQSVRLVISAGAALPAETAVRFRETYGQPVHVFYGASESGGIAYDREGGAGERGTVGTLVDGVRITLEPLAGQGEAEAGVVTVRSLAVGACYVPAADARLGFGQFQTSDVACWSAGELQLVRRVDGLINVKGKKVDPSEIEAVLTSLAGVEEVVALGIAAADTGSQVVRVVIACRPGRLTYEDVLAWCRPRLADYKVPRSVLLVAELPHTSRGKVDRAALSDA